MMDRTKSLKARPTEYELHDLAESPAEHELYHALINIYGVNNVKAQVSVDRFRVDAMTDDGVAWEVDGKKYHNIMADIKRDEAILLAGKATKLIRIPAAAVWFYRNAVTCAMQSVARKSTPVPANVINVDDEYMQITLKNCELNESLEVDCLRGAQCFGIHRDCGFVGTPLAFISRDNSLWRHVPDKDIGKLSWIGVVESRTLRNRKSWSRYAGISMPGGWEEFKRCDNEA